MNQAPLPTKFNLLRTFKLGTFHIGSALADILVSGVWNRVLIRELGISATPVALLIGLRYLLAPVSLWAGHRSDTQPLFGKYRLPYIYIGRLLLWLALPLLPLSIVELSRDSASVAGWVLSLAIFVLYGLGTFISGAPYLALVRASAPPSRKGLAIIIVETFLLSGFAIVPITYSLLMRTYTIEGFWRLVVLAMIGGALAWGVSVWGEERTAPEFLDATDEQEANVPLSDMVRRMWNQPNTRLFFGVLALGAVALFAQDAVLEPLGAELFNLDVAQTTRFSAYYGTGVLLTMIIGSLLTRKWLPQSYTTLTTTGLVLVMLTLALLVYTTLAHIEFLLTPMLFLFGVASGVYTVGGLNLMVAMTDERYAGAYLGVWSLAQLVFRGVGIALGGITFDAIRLLTNSSAMGYAAVFVMEIGAAAIALVWILKVARYGYLFTPPQPSGTAEIFAIAGD